LVGLSGKTIFLMTREELENKMAVLLGGRAAELVKFGELSTGAEDDLAKVTDIARAMVVRFGMVDALGNVTYEREPHNFLSTPPGIAFPSERRYSEETAREIDTAVPDIVQAAFERASSIVREKRDVLERGANLLLEQETLGEEDLRRLTGRPRQAA
jgi:cell division protease FtsH